MKELIKISENQGTLVVSARELHNFLEVSSNFRTWIERMFAYGFEENQDYTLVSKNGRQNIKKEYALTLDCAKEISMIQRNEKGKQARKYFIDCEKDLKENKKLQNLTEDQLLLQAFTVLKTRDELQKKQLKLQAPKVEYFNEVLQSKSTYNANQIAKEFGFSAVTLNRMLANLNIQYKQNGTWLLYARYQDKNYTKTKTFTYVGTDGSTKTSQQLVWTEVGRKFLHEVIRQQKIANKAINDSLLN